MLSRKTFTLFFSAILCVFALPLRAEDAKKPDPQPESKPKQETKKMETITLGAGCFWCVEAVLQRIKGVESVKSGYSGGTVKNPSYRDVCNGTTGHAEVVQVEYDPAVLPTEKLLTLFFHLHDPTTLNRQGADVGTQYRSAIYYHNDEQKQIAEKVKKQMMDSGEIKGKIVTEITKFDTFYKAEDYHQDYYNENSNEGYCRMVITPKLKKLGLETK